MSTVLTQVSEPRTQAERTAFNLIVWKKLQADEQLAGLNFRIETDQHGQIIISPPTAPSHGNRQSEIARLLGNWNPGGKVISPSNTGSEIREKKRLYFEAGAQEVWYCQADGSLEFFLSGTPEESADSSRIYPDFPGQIN